MKYFLIGFLFVFSYKVINNIFLYCRAKYYARKYADYLTNRKVNFSNQVSAAKRIFKSAGLSDCYIPVAENIGYGLVSSDRVSVMENMSRRRSDVADCVMELFERATGIFRDRIIESFSPMYWIRTLIFLPSHILSYLGVDSNSIASKILQVIYWLAAPLCVAFWDHIRQYIITLLG